MAKVEITAHTVWLYVRFALSFAQARPPVEEMMAARRVLLSYETVQRWTLKFGYAYANECKRWRPQLGNTWHLDEVFLTIHGTTASRWRAVDQPEARWISWSRAVAPRHCSLR